MKKRTISIGVIFALMVTAIAIVPATAAAATATSSFKCSSSSYSKYAPSSLHNINSRVHFKYDNGIIYDDVIITMPRLYGQTYKVSVTMTATNGTVAKLNKTVSADTKFVCHCKLPFLKKCKTVKATIVGKYLGTDTWTIKGK